MNASGKKVISEIGNSHGIPTTIMSVRHKWVSERQFSYKQNTNNIFKKKESFGILFVRQIAIARRRGIMTDKIKTHLVVNKETSSLKLKRIGIWFGIIVISSDR